MSMQGGWYPTPPGPIYGPPIPPAMADPYGIASLYQAPGQSFTPGSSPLAGFNAPSAVDSLYASAEGAGNPLWGGIKAAGSGGGFSPLAEAAGFPGLRAAFGKAAPGAALAAFGPGLINQTPLPTDAKDLAGNTVAGLGWGLTASAFAPEFAPFLIPGGAAAGFAKGALEDLFGSGNAPSGPSFSKDDLNTRTQELQSLMNSAGVPQATQERVVKSFTVNYNIAPDDASRQQVYAAMQQGIAQQVAQQVNAPTQLTPEQILATQALATSVMKPYADQLQSQAASGQAIYNNLADNAPNAGIAALARTMGQHSLEGATKLAAAYQSQALMLPGLNALQLANQYGQAAYPKVGAYPAASSTTPSIQALLAQAQASGG